MATEFTLPLLGEEIESATIVKMLVATGETVEEDQAVMEVEAGKATMEVPSTVAGTVGEIFVKAGDSVKTGQKIFAVSGGAESAAAPAEAKPAAAEAPAAAASTKAAAPAKAAPPAAPPKAAALAKVQAPSHAAHNGAPANGASSAPLPAAPSVRRLARELDVDLAQVRGSGEHGRISYADVKNFLQRRVGSAAGAAPGYAAAPLPDFSKWGEVERQKMNNIRIATARHMARCWAEVPHVTQFDKADITGLEKLRKKHGPRAEKAGGKLTVTAIALKVVATALKLYPRFNASIDLASEEIVLKKYINIGVAVDTERGLVVPVIRNVDAKSIFQIAAELTELGEKARARKTTAEEMQGGSITVTNLGGIGGTAFTPIVNVPEVAIVGLSRGTIEPVWNGTAFEPRLMLPISLSYDHRVIDGADGARFARFIATALEEPFLLSLEG